MKRLICAALALCACLAGFARAVELNDLLVSLQDRQRLVEQRSQVTQELGNELYETAYPIPEAFLIQWTAGLGEDPSPSTVAALGIAGKVAVLNQAVGEFERLKRQYLNVRPQDFSVEGAQVGALRRYLEDDFAVLPRVTPENYNEILMELAWRTRRLQALQWPFGARQRTHNWWTYQWQSDSDPIEVEPEAPSGVLPWGTSSIGGTSLMTDLYDQWQVTNGERVGFSEWLEYYASYQEVISEDEDEEQHTYRSLSSNVNFYCADQVRLQASTEETDSIEGMVYLMGRTHWTPATDVTVPTDWDLNDSSFQLLGSSAGGTITLPAPGSISIGGDWVTTYSGADGTDKAFVPDGYDDLADWLASDQSGDEDWLKSHEKREARPLRRDLFAVIVPTFEHGIDAAGYPGLLDQTAVIKAAPGADGTVALNPRPNLLFGIDLGPGLEGGGNGLVTVSVTRSQIPTTIDEGRGTDDLLSPYEPSYEFSDMFGNLIPKRGYRFDLASHLRFAGAAKDYHVVYEDRRDQRGAELPHLGMYQEFYPGDIYYDTWCMYYQWEMPRLRQVVGRDLVADISYQGHYAATVNIYRRPTSAGAVDRTPGTVLSVSGYPLVRSYSIGNPDATGVDYPPDPEKLVITDTVGSTVKAKHEITRDSIEIYDEKITFKTSGATGADKWRKEIDNRSPSGPGATGAVVTVYQDGASTGARTMSPEWNWWGHTDPAQATAVAGGVTTVVNTTNDFGPGSQGGRQPTTISLTRSSSTNDNMSLTWTSDGILQQATQGAWVYNATVSGSLIEGITKFGSARTGTQWTEMLDGGRRIRSYSAPDGNVTSRTASETAWSEVEYGSSSQLPGLPYYSRSKDGGGGVFTWSAAGDGSWSAQVDDGLMSGNAVTRGSRQITNFNARGFRTSSESYALLGSTLKVAGTSTPTAVNTWGAPVAALDFNTGRQSSWGYDGYLSRLTSVTEAMGLGAAVNSSSYDCLGRVTSFTWNGSSGSLAYGGGAKNLSLFLTGIMHFSGNTWDALGRPTSGSSTIGGSSTNWSITRTAGTESMWVGNGTTGGSATIVSNKADGTGSISGALVPFSGVTGTAMSVSGGLLKTYESVTGQAGAYREIYSDAWGRVRKVVSAPASGAGAGDLTQITYSPPALAVKRVERRDAAGQREIEEIDPWNSAGIVASSGLDLSGDGTLGAGDRYMKRVTSVVAGKLRTAIFEMEDGGEREVLRTDVTPGGSSTVTTINGGEETLTTTPNFATRTLTTSSSKGWVRTATMTNLWQPDSITVTGTGVPSETLDPTWRADGSLVSVSYAIGGATMTATMDLDGRLSGLTDPLLGSIFTSQTFSAGAATSVIDGVTRSERFDGTQSSVAGTDIMTQTVTAAVDGGGFKETIHPGTGSDTVRRFNAAGLKSVHDYAAGNDPTTSWLPGGLENSTVGGRGGSVTNAYSTDGAKDLLSITPAAVSSTGFGALSTLAQSFTYNRAGRVKTIGDASGMRELLYSNGRLYQTDYTGGTLNPYRVVRKYDAKGRHYGLEVYRDGIRIHEIGYSFNGNSDELSGITSGSFTSSYGRNIARDLTSVTRGSTVQGWGRGTAGRVTTVTTTGVPGAPSFAYNTFDSKGRRKDCVTSGGTWSYNYSTAGQISSASHPVYGSFAYAFDGIGRRVGTDSLNRTLTWATPTTKPLIVSADPDARVWINAGEVAPFDGSWIYNLNTPGPSGGWLSWQVLATLAGAGDPGASSDAKAQLSGWTWFAPSSESISYDAEGNREGNSLMEYGWNGLDQLVRARTRNLSTAPQGYDVTFDYDAEGRRFRKLVKRYESGVLKEDKIVTFVWDGWNPAYERHELADGTLLFERKYGWGEGVTAGAGSLELIREKRGETTTDYYPFFDGTGHLVALSTAAGSLAAEYVYGPFGELVRSRGAKATSNPWRYAGKYRDEETGLYYFGHRYYDPVTGQWLSREPLGESESLNLYAYCLNDPLNKIDLLGLAPRDISREVATLHQQYEGLMGIIEEAGHAVTEGRGSDACIEEMLSRFQSGYTAYLKGVTSLQQVVIADQTSHGMFEAYWHREGLSNNNRYAFGMDIVPRIPGAETLVGDRVLHALSMSKTLSEIGAAGYQSHIDMAAVVKGELETMQTRVNYLSAATGVAGVGRALVVKVGAEGAKAGAVYLTRTAAGFAISYAGSAVVQAGIGEAKAHGYITEEQANYAAIGVSALQLMITHKAMKAQAAAGAPPQPTGRMKFPCFPAGTMVLMANGSTKAIEDIQRGDEVLADTPEDGAEPCSRKVVSMSINETERFIVLSIDENGDGTGDSTLEATAEHPFWTIEHGWRSAADLKTGNTLVDEKGSGVKIATVGERKAASFTFNLTVEGIHTYYVMAGKRAVLVHNQQLEFDYAADAKSLLRQALSQQGLTAPPANFKQEWSANGYDYEVRIHSANPVWGKNGSIVRIARRLQGVIGNNQGNGWEYIDDKGNWWKTSLLKPGNAGYNPWAAADTHIELIKCK